MSNQAMNAARIAFGVTGAGALGTGWIIFRDLTDFSQWFVERTNRNDTFQTFKKRNEIAGASLASTVANTAIVFRTNCVPKPVWAAINGTSLFMVYMGYLNPEIMMRARNRNAMYVPASKAKELLEGHETVIVTRLGDSEPRAFPDKQIVRPHVARVGNLPSGIPATICYCGLTGGGIVYETPPHENGKEMDLVPLTQLENNLILIDKSTGHVGHQINGLNETVLLEKLGGESYEETARRPSTAKLAELEMKVAKEVPSWRMTLDNFIRTYPEGEVFINDYKEFPDLKRPVRAIYDSIIDIIFARAIHQHNTQPEPIFPTVKNIDKRLPIKERIWGFNVGDDYACVTEKFVRDGPKGVWNMTVGGVPLVASWDSEASTLGIWRRPSQKPVTKTVDVHGRIGGQGPPLERLNTVKNGFFWFVWQNFFPKTTVNPES